MHVYSLERDPHGHSVTNVSLIYHILGDMILMVADGWWKQSQGCEYCLPIKKCISLYGKLSSENGPWKWTLGLKLDHTALLGPAARFILPSGQCRRWRKPAILPKILCSYHSFYVHIKHRIPVILPMFLWCLIEEELNSPTPLRPRFHWP